MSHNKKICVIGLGYVGLPVAVCFARNAHVIGFDISDKRLDELRQGLDSTNEYSQEELKGLDIHYTSDPSEITEADFYIVTVPTPINEAKQPDLSPLQSASEIVGSCLNEGDIVVYESTVYPGATEEYFTEIKKVVSGQTDEICEIIAEVYGSIINAGIHKAPSIKVAEAAKVIENTQRDLNIALMNELSLIFEKMDIDTLDVLEAAGTKWNFLPFTPGLVLAGISTMVWARSLQIEL